MKVASIQLWQNKFSRKRKQAGTSSSARARRRAAMAAAAAEEAAKAAAMAAASANLINSGMSQLISTGKLKLYFTICLVKSFEEKYNKSYTLTKNAFKTRICFLYQLLWS